MIDGILQCFLSYYKLYLFVNLVLIMVVLSTTSNGENASNQHDWSQHSHTCKNRVTTLSMPHFGLLMARVASRADCTHHAVDLYQC